MTVLRQLWASIWVRWRLLAIGARRLFGGRSAAAGAEPGVHRDAAEIPIEGVDYDVSELPAELMAGLDAVRVELTDHARDLAGQGVGDRGRVRRRTAGAAVTATLVLGVLGAGAAAVVTGTTGVPAVDRLLGIHEQTLEQPGGPGRSGDLRPRASGESVSVEVPVAAGVQPIVGSFYATRDGAVCSAITDSVGSARGSLGAVGCTPASSVAERLQRDDGYVASINANTDGDAIVISGFVRDDVASLQGRGPTGAIDARVGDRWAVDVPGIDSLKPFVGFMKLGSGAGQGLPAGADASDLIDAQRYVLDAITDDGDRIRISG